MTKPAAGRHASGIVLVLVSACAFGAMAILARGVFANHFSCPDEEVITLWSSHPVTYRGPVLELPERRTAFDAWNGVKLEPRPLPRGKFELSVEIAPRGVGCIVVTR